MVIGGFMHFSPAFHHKKSRHTRNLLLIIILFLSTGSCAILPDFIHAQPIGRLGKPHENITDQEASIRDMLNHSTDILRKLFKDHLIDRLNFKVQKMFIERYNRTLDPKYISNGSTTFCNVYFYDYYIDLGYGDILRKIEMMSGITMVEKALNYVNEMGDKAEIKILKSAYDAQRYANAGHEVGVIGEYYYDKAESIYTRHYSVVQPSLIAYDNWGTRKQYWVYGLQSYRTDVNNRKGEGAFLSQVGVANGLVDFRWAYNRKLDYLIQKDRDGNIRGGIIFILFPDEYSGV